MAFVIHDIKNSDRTDIVKEIVSKTKATHYQAIMLPNKREGCLNSHLGVARLARGLHPDKHYLVFEDDCVLSDDWQEALKGMEFVDVLYLGYNDKCDKAVFGTHAYCLSPKARDILLEHAHEVALHVEVPFAIDWILSALYRKYGLVVAMPKMEDRERYCHQKRGFVSQITGQIRN